MNRTRIAALAVTALALTGCGTTAAATAAPANQQAPSSPAPSAPAAVTAANPVTIVRQAGATPAPGAVHGNTWLSGLEALGSFSTPYHDTWDYEAVTVYTLNPGVSQTGEQAAAAVGAASSDSQVVIVGPDFYMYVTPVGSGSRPAWPVSPQIIAARVHGTVLAP